MTATLQPQITKTHVVSKKSRAVVRDVEAGCSVDCSRCGERVKFQAKVRNKQAICNIYVKGKWNRVEHFHLACYEEAGSPYGEPRSAPTTASKQQTLPRQSGPSVWPKSPSWRRTTSRIRPTSP